MKWLSFVLSAIILCGCSGISIKKYENTQPKLVLENYLNGKMTAHGVFMKRSGYVEKTFTVALNTTWKDNVGTLVEDFVWSDGTKSTRTWTITKQSNGTYIGTAPDVVGQAIGESAGNAYHWNYVLKLPVDDTTYDITFDDWMFLVDNKVMLNKAVMTKYGFRVGEVLISFTKP
ncbi:MAG: DUF3833 domain-containing protein [Bdellovibrio sp.]|nr:DUF3833 domain-containing protein [Bdellovibrio sp.]